MAVNLDLALASALDVFGQEASYIPAGAQEPTTPVTVIFEASHELVELDGANVPISTTAPVVTVALPTADVGTAVKRLPEEPARGCQFIIGGATYEAYDIHPNGRGGAKLPLHKVS